MKKLYSIPIAWESYTRINVEAKNLEEAVTKALKEFFMMSDEYYIEDSFEIDSIIDDEYPNETFDMDKILNKIL